MGRSARSWVHPGGYPTRSRTDSPRVFLIPECAERTVIVWPERSRSAMPVTAKLSRKFYEKFGDDIANELVEWFNAVDATYRGYLREFHELNYARLDAKLEQRVVELDAKLEQRIAELRAEMQVGFATLSSAVDSKLAQLETRLTKRMFGFWIAQAATTAALVLGVVKLLHY